MFMLTYTERQGESSKHFCRITIAPTRAITATAHARLARGDGVAGA